MSVGRSRQRGLSLIELMVVVAILAVLATVGYPLYTQQVLKNRRADAKASLKSIALAQERYYTANGRYTASLGSLSIDSDLQTGQTENDYYSLALATANNGQTFTISASNNAIQADDKCNNYSLDYRGVQSNSGPSNCW